MMVLLMGEFYGVRHRDGLRWHDIRTKIHYDQFRHSTNITIITATIREGGVLVLLMGGTYEVLR
jgi:hypothetical protein